MNVRCPFTIASATTMSGAGGTKIQIQTLSTTRCSVKHGDPLSQAARALLQLRPGRLAFHHAGQHPPAQVEDAMHVYIGKLDEEQHRLAEPGATEKHKTHLHPISHSAAVRL